MVTIIQNRWKNWRETQIVLTNIDLSRLKNAMLQHILKSLSVADRPKKNLKVGLCLIFAFIYCFCYFFHIMFESPFVNYSLLFAFLFFLTLFGFSYVDDSLLTMSSFSIIQMDIVGMYFSKVEYLSRINLKVLHLKMMFILTLIVCYAHTRYLCAKVERLIGKAWLEKVSRWGIVSVQERSRVWYVEGRDGDRKTYA